MTAVSHSRGEGTLEMRKTSRPCVSQKEGWSEERKGPPLFIHTRQNFRLSLAMDGGHPPLQEVAWTPGESKWGQRPSNARLGGQRATPEQGQQTRRGGGEASLWEDRPEAAHTECTGWGALP